MHALKGRKKTEEHKRKIAFAHLGKKASKETREKMSKNRKGKRGHSLSEVTKEKLRLLHLGKKSSPETMYSLP